MGSAVIMPQPKGINTIARLIGHREQNSIHQQILAKVGSRFFDDTVPGRLQSSLSVPIESEVGAAMFMDVNQLIQWSLKAMFLNLFCAAAPVPRAYHGRNKYCPFRSKMCPQKQAANYPLWSPTD